MKKIIHIFISCLTTFLLIFTLAQLSFIWTGTPETQGEIVITARLTKTVIKVCRNYTAEELKTIPAHMRGPQLCEQNAKPYQLQVTVDEKRMADEIINPQTSRGDHPMNIHKVIPLPSGNYQLSIQLTPNTTDLPSYSFEDRIVIESGKKVFVTLNEEGNRFVVY